MGTIPGYQVVLGQKQVERCLERCHYAHFLAGRNFVPLDAKLFAYRRLVGAVASPHLVMASILSKKIAVGLNRMGLEIRVGRHGNFGTTYSEARSNADRFLAVARILEIDAVVVLTEASSPYQPYIGRGESLVALQEVLEGTAGEWLQRHVNLCWSIATLSSDHDSAMPPPPPNELCSAFKDNIEAQGSSFEQFTDRVEELRKAPSFEYYSSGSGVLTIKLEVLRDAVIHFQKSRQADEDFPDPVGVELIANHGENVDKGDLIARVRAPEKKQQSVRMRLEKVFEIADQHDASSFNEGTIIEKVSS